jgi:transposase-like protein
VLNGLTGRIPVTTLCKLNNVTPSLFYEWREKFLARGKDGLMANGGKSQRESELEKKINILERCIGELTLEKELLKKLQD